MFKLECLQIYQNMRIIYIATSCVSFHSYLCTCIAFPLSHINNPSLVNQSVKLLTVGPRIFLTIFFPQPGDELLWWNDSHFLLLSCNAVEEVRQAGEQALLPSRLDLIGQHFLPEGPAKVQCLQHWVTVAGVAKLSDQIAIGGRTDQRLMKDMWWHTCTYNLCNICN